MTGVSDIDIQAWRHGTDSSMDRNELSKQFRQSNISSLVQHSDDFATSLREEVNSRIETSICEHTKYLLMRRLAVSVASGTSKGTKRTRSFVKVGRKGTQLIPAA
jgi:hypothetical protein